MTSNIGSHLIQENFDQLTEINKDEVLAKTKSEVFELLKQHEIARQIPVIIVSADAMPAQVNKLLEAGVKQYLTKPFDVPAFLQIIDQYTNH